MRWPTLWQVVSLLAARGLAQSATPTVCEDESCRCDAFTKVICNCTHNYDEVTLRPDGAYRVPSTATGIIVDGCARVYFLPDTIRHLIQLRSVELRNVHHIYIHERSLAWNPYSRESDKNPGLKISIHNSTINEISSHAIQGVIDDIVISDSKINLIKSFAFSNLAGVKKIELIDNVYENIDRLAFRKFSTGNFILRGGSTGTLPSRFLSDVEVTDLFRIDGITIKYLSSSTFIVSLPKKVLIENNLIDTLEGDCFIINTRGPIIFRNNTLTNLRNGAFHGFTVDFEVVSVLGRQELLMDNNTITNMTPSSLMYNQTAITLQIDSLNLNTTCACEMIEKWSNIIRQQRSALSCWYSLEGNFVSVSTYGTNRCGEFKQHFWIFILVGVILVVLIAIVITFCIVKRENEKNKKIQVVMPDGKTYRETEFHIVVERAELLTTDL